MAKRSGFLRQIPLYVIAIAFGVVMIYPFLLMTATSFKTEADTWSYPSSVIPREMSLLSNSRHKRDVPSTATPFVKIMESPVLILSFRIRSF